MSREVTKPTLLSAPQCNPCVPVVSDCVLGDGDLMLSEPQTTGVRLNNSAMLGNIDSHLSYLPKNQREDIVKLLQKFPTLFSDVPGRTTMLSHDIDVGNSVPINQHPYRVNPAKREIMKTEVDYLRQNGLAVPSQSPWSSPCLFVPKSRFYLSFLY